MAGNSQEVNRNALTLEGLARLMAEQNAEINRRFDEIMRRLPPPHLKEKEARSRKREARIQKVETWISSLDTFNTLTEIKVKPRKIQDLLTSIVPPPPPSKPATPVLPSPNDIYTSISLEAPPKLEPKYVCAPKVTEQLLVEDSKEDRVPKATLIFTPPKKEILPSSGSRSFLSSLATPWLDATPKVSSCLPFLSQEEEPDIPLPEPPTKEIKEVPFSSSPSLTLKIFELALPLRDIFCVCCGRIAYHVFHGCFAGHLDAKKIITRSVNGKEPKIHNLSRRHLLRILRHHWDATRKDLLDYFEDSRTNLFQVGEDDVILTGLPSESIQVIDPDAELLFPAPLATSKPMHTAMPTFNSESMPAPPILMPCSSELRATSLEPSSSTSELPSRHSTMAINGDASSSKDAFNDGKRMNQEAPFGMSNSTHLFLQFAWSSPSSTSSSMPTSREDKFSSL